MYAVSGFSSVHKMLSCRLVKGDNLTAYLPRQLNPFRGSFMRVFLLTALVALLIADSACADDSAEQVLAGMTAAYGSLRSYKDTGTVTSKILGWDYEITFDTAFVRPNLFRFAWVAPHPFPPLKHLTTQSAICSNSSGTTTSTEGWGQAPQTLQNDSLQLAVAGATGVSGGSAHTIATLLMPKIWTTPFGVSLPNLESPRLIGIETVEGTECYHIAGTAPRVGQYDLWIGTRDHLLRKLERVVADSPEVELHRNIEINEEIAAQSFSPPTR
jgi:hypothetical protein